MKLSRVASSGPIEAGRNHGVVALVACLLLPCLLLSVLKSNFHAFSIGNLQVSIGAAVQIQRIQDGTYSSPLGSELRIMPVDLKEELVVNQSSSSFNPIIQETGQEAKETLSDIDVRSSSELYKQILHDNITTSAILVEPLQRVTEEKQSENKTNTDIKSISSPTSDKETQIEERNNRTTGSELRIMPVDLKEELVVNQSSSSFNPIIQETGQEAKETLSDIEVRSSSESYKQVQHDNITTSAILVEPLQRVTEEKQSENKTNTDIKSISSPTSDKETQIEERNNRTTENLVLQSNMWCDFSHYRYDTCFLNGDVRVLGPTSTLILATQSQQNDTILKTRPYARKWESTLMKTISELTLRSSSKPEETPLCTVNHNVPAIIFSTGGFAGNFFHDFTDVLVPLFITSRQYRGQVQFLITDYKAQWVNKYMAVLSQLTRYEIINLDAQDGQVRCFTQAQIGLMYHKVMGVDPTNTPNGYTMENFKDMLRTSFSLKRKSIRAVTKKPRLLILQRRGSRSIVNKREVIGLGRRLGFKVVVAGTEETKNLSRFARSVNSADVLMGVHGAGLANMVFLPTGASLIQIVPWGGLKWICRYDFGEPAPEMGVRYLDYEIKEEESTLIQQYPRDHPVFTDPESVQKQGWNVLWSVFLHKQNVMLDIHRFKPTLLEVLNSKH